MIEVRLPFVTLTKLPQSRGESFGQACDRYILGLLKDAGAPIDGNFAPKLARGQIERQEDDERGELVFVWKEAA